MEKMLEEERRELREEMTRLAMEQKELKIRFEQAVEDRNQMLGKATGKEARLDANCEQRAEEDISYEEGWEENKVGSEAALEERMWAVASKMEESCLLRVEAKLNEMVEAAVRLKLGDQAEQEQLEKSLKVEQLEEKVVMLRLAAERNQLPNCSNYRSGAVCYNELSIF